MRKSTLIGALLAAAQCGGKLIDHEEIVQLLQKKGDAFATRSASNRPGSPIYGDSAVYRSVVRSEIESIGEDLP